jgi:cell division transport system permease protein
MIRIAYIAREFGRNLRRHAGTTVASLLSLALLFLLFDLFWIAAGSADRFYRDLLSELTVEAFVSEAFADSTVTELSNQIVQLESVYDLEFISRDQARQRLAGMVGTDLLVGYEDSNPLPRSFILQIEDAFISLESLTRLEHELLQIDGVSEVHYSRDWLYKAEKAKEIMLQVGLVLGALIFGAALISSANSIRLATRARAVGFRHMLLLGAGRFLIAFPFVLESLLISGFAAGVGWGVILYTRTRITFTQLEIIFPTNDQILIYCVALSLLGALSGYIGIRRQLKV